MKLETGRQSDCDAFILFVIRFAVSGGERQDVSTHKHTAENTSAGLNIVSEALQIFKAREATRAILSSDLWSGQQTRLQRLRSQLDEFLSRTRTRTGLWGRNVINTL